MKSDLSKFVFILLFVAFAILFSLLLLFALGAVLILLYTFGIVLVSIACDNDHLSSGYLRDNFRITSVSV